MDFFPGQGIVRRETVRIENTNPSEAINLSWTPKSIAITNPTPFPVYINIGTSSKASRLSCDEILLPLSGMIIDPNGSRDFNFTVDNSSALNYPFSFPVLIVFTTGSPSSQFALSTTLATILSSTYDSKVINLIGTDLLMFIAMEDTTGTTAVDLISNNNWQYGASNVVLNQAGIGDGNPSVKFNGAANGRVDPTAAALTALNAIGKFNSEEGTLSIWLNVTVPDMNSVTSFSLMSIGADVNNFYAIEKVNPNLIQTVLFRGGIATAVRQIAYNGGSWLNFTITWSASSNVMRAYANGTQISTDTALAGVWAGALVLGYTQIAAQNFGLYTSGFLAKAILAKRALAGAEVARLAAIP